MTLRERDTVMQRMLVALDSSADSLSGLETAADVAMRLNAELMGLFVKDARLVELARLPCAREVRLNSAWTKRMRPTTMERQLKVKEAAARRAVETAAAKRRVEWSFRVTAQEPDAALMAAEPEIDLILIARRVGRQLARFAVAADTVVWGAAPADQRRGISVTYDGSPIAKRALAAAARLAKEIGLNVLIPAGEHAPERRREATAELVALGVPAWFMPLASGDLRAVAHAVRANRSTVFVLACDSALLGGEPVDRLIAEISVPVLLVRPGRG
jgi:nucleotide-binding universal stress UspA family protein